MSYDNLTLRKYFLQFDGGFATQEEPSRILDNQSPDMVNIQPVGKGSYAPRNGVRRIGNDRGGDGQTISIYNFSRTGRLASTDAVASLETLISSYGTALEYLPSNNTWATIPGVPAYTANQEFGFAHDINYVYGCNAVDDFFIWDGKSQATTAFTVTAGNDTIDVTAHGMITGQLVKFSSSGTLPAGLDANVTYYVVNVTTDTFKVSLTRGGAAVDITDTGSGTHSLTSSIKAYSSNPKGNIMAFYLQKLFIAGVKDTPATLYYSVTGTPTDFANAGSGTFQFGEGGDPITALKSLTVATEAGGGEQRLLVFKKSTRIYMVSLDSSGNLTQKELKRDTGALNNKSTIIIDNDVFYIDDGNNIANLGYATDIANEVRTGSTTRTIDRTVNSISFENACSIYWKKRRMAFYWGKSFDSDINDYLLVYFADFGSWWRWTGLYANQATLYQGEPVWASAIDKNVYKYDETVFDDNYDGSEDEGAGAIYSYRATRDEEFVDRNGIPLADRYKQERFVPIRGYISPGGSMTIKVIYDGNIETAVEQSFTGTDEDITTQEISVYFGSIIFGSQAFGGGAALSETAFPMREFFAVVSLDGYSNLRARVVTEVQGAGTPYLVTNISMWAELSADEKWPAGIKL